MKTLDELSFAHRFDTISGSAIREILKLTMQPGMISFAGGNPARSALPDEQVKAICEKVMAENGKGILQYWSSCIPICARLSALIFRRAAYFP